ncbi:MAG: acyl carrier protein [Tissierellia bacterium]|nr:acyl carrier protein [Tissierellia bacterium]
MKERVLALIAEQFNLEVNQLGPDTHFVDDMNADSIELVELVMSLEEEFGIELEEEQLTNIQTIGDVLDLMESLED